MAEIPEAIALLQNAIEFIETVGIPGLLVMFFIGPVMIVVALFILEKMRHHDEMRREETRRDEQNSFFDFMREQQEKHRAAMDRQLKDLTAKHAEVVEFYEENVDLVKQYQRLATDFRDVVINNTRAVEHLTSIGQANFFCPIAREKATGKQ